MCNVAGGEVLFSLLPRMPFFSLRTLLFVAGAVLLFRAFSEELRRAFYISFFTLVLFHAALFGIFGETAFFGATHGAQVMYVIIGGIGFCVLGMFRNAFFPYRFTLYGILNTIFLFLVVLLTNTTPLVWDGIHVHLLLLMVWSGALFYEAFLVYGVLGARRAGLYALVLALLLMEFMSQIAWFPLTPISLAALTTLFGVMVRDGIFVAYKGFFTPSYLFRALVIFVGIGSIICALASWRLSA